MSHSMVISARVSGEDYDKINAYIEKLGFKAGKPVMTRGEFVSRAVREMLRKGEK